MSNLFLESLHLCQLLCVDISVGPCDVVDQLLEDLLKCFKADGLEVFIFFFVLWTSSRLFVYLLFLNLLGLRHFLFVL